MSMGIENVLGEKESFIGKVGDGSNASILSSQRSNTHSDKILVDSKGQEKLPDKDTPHLFSYNLSINDQPSWSNYAFIKAYIENTDVLISNRLKLWYSTIPTNVLNLYELTGNKGSIFVLHGESLLFHTILRAHKIGFDFTELTSGQQILQLFYLLERLISDLIESGGKFHIVFFSLYKNLCAEFQDIIFMSSFPMLRELFLLHCKLNFDIPTYEFLNWYDDPRWFNYIVTSEPSCMLLEDGSSFLYKYNKVYKLVSVDNKTANSLKSKAKNASAVDITDEYLEWVEISKAIDKFCFTTHSLIYICIIKNLYVAYMFDMRKRSAGFQIHNVNFSRTILSNDISSNIFNYLSAYFKKFETDHNNVDCTLVDSVNWVLEQLEKGYTLRDILASHCYTQFLEANSDSDAEDLQTNLALSRFLFKCTILHNYIISKLNLSQRVDMSGCFLPNEIMLNWEFYNVYVCGYLDFSFETIRAAISQFNTLKSEELLNVAGQISSQLVDLLDGKILQRIIYDIVIKFTLNSDITEKNFAQTFSELYIFSEEDLGNISSIWEGLSGCKQGFFPIKKADLANILGLDSFKSYSSGPQSDIVADNSNFTMLTNDLLMEEFSAKWINYSNFEDDSALVNNELFTELGYRDPNGVMRKKDVIDVYLENQVKHKEAEPIKHLSDIELKNQQRIEQRNLQRYKQLSFLLSKYLGSNNLHHPIVVQTEHIWIELKKSLLISLSNSSANAISADSSRGKSKNKAKPVSDVSDLSHRGKPKGPKGEAHVSKAQLLKEKNIQARTKKKYESDKQTLAPYEIKLNQLSSDLDYGNIYNQILEFTSGPSRIGDMISDFKWVKSTFSTDEYQLKFLLLLIKNVHTALAAFKLRLAKTDKEFRNISKCICLLFCLVKDVFNTYKPLIDREMIVNFQKVLISIGFINSARNMFNHWKDYISNLGSSANASLVLNSGSKAPPKPLPKNDLPLDPKDVTILDTSIPFEKEYDIQLEYMGDIMERTLGSTEDKRVLFKPDGWQKLLLDVIDARLSALVCAPTAAGKTYICYYAMEQVLRMDDLGVVIYVSPNTALAFQVTYEITARFSSKIYRSSDISITPVLNASFLEKFHDPTWKCAQILVTVPQILEMLLLSLRSGEREYVRRIEYIIFDEIHCISHSDIGQYLERCIHLSCSPFLALSATVGNPSEFHAWLTRVNNNRQVNNKNGSPNPSGIDGVHLATFDERYSDLKLAIYTVERGVQSLNPVTCLSHSRLMENGFPIGFNVCSFDCFAFLTTLFHFLPPNVMAELEYLRPINYFSGSIAITKRQYRYYWGACKCEIERQIQNGNITNECLEATYFSLKNRKSTSGKMDIFPDFPITLRNPAAPEVNQAAGNERLDDCFDAKNFIKMLKDLDKASGMPCLAFILDRVHMEQLMISLVRTLEQMQHDKYYGGEEATLATKMENKRRMDRYNALVRQHEMNSKLKTLSREQKEEQGIDVNTLTDEPLPPPPIDIAKEYDPEFNFSNRRVYTSYTDEVDNFINMAKYSIKGKFGAEEYVEGLRRGIGIHHEGLSHKFTMFTETLFRMGFLKVVIASRTLAFGVNMPCKSVIFVGDNYELNSLMYQQMSGRCGRRGFDLSGNVLFWSIPKKKIFQLLTAALPNLTGTNYICSPTLLLRNLALFETLFYRDALEESDAALTKVKHSQQKSSRGKAGGDLSSAQIIDQCRSETLRTSVVSNRLRSIYQNPLALLNHEKSTSKDALRINSLLYAAEILVKLGLVDENGFPINCCEYPVILHQEHPTNLLIAFALQSGQLHNLLAGDCEKLIAEITYPKFSTTCSILNIQNLPSFILLNLLSAVTNKHSLTGSTVVMKRLENQLDGLALPMQSHAVTPDIFPMVVKLPVISEIIDKYNRIISSVIPKYFQSCFAVCDPLRQNDYKLPLSKLSFGGGDHKGRSGLKLKIFSPFMCLNNQLLCSEFEAGCQTSIVDLIYLGQMVYKFDQLTSMLTLESIPVIEENIVQMCNIASVGGGYYLVDAKQAYLCNSYMLDFWLSGRFDFVRDRNGLGQYAWAYLFKFLQFINFSRYMLQEYTKSSPNLKYHNLGYDLVYQAFDDLYKRIEPLFSKI